MSLSFWKPRLWGTQGQRAWEGAGSRGGTGVVNTGDTQARALSQRHPAALEGPPARGGRSRVTPASGGFRQGTGMVQGRWEAMTTAQRRDR